MKINELDLLHHKALLGNVTARQELDNRLELGIKNKCPIAQEFINRLDASENKKNLNKVKNPALASINRAIIKWLEKPYILSVWFMLASVILSSMMGGIYA